ncbi:MAG: phosphoribosyltransferase [Clostridium lundense]|nr:phosphoribosyltransferase [Clostridium lundense]
MNKIIIISTEVFLDLDYDKKEKFNEIINKIIEEKNAICIVSKSLSKLDNAKKQIHNTSVYYRTRNEIKNIILKNKDKPHYFIVFGNRDRDFELAVNNKFLYLVPLWTKDNHAKCIKYGVHIKNIDIFYEVIRTINNQNKWYYKLDLDDGTKIYSLISAHTRKGNISSKEKELVQGFEDFLKKGDISYYEILLYHFLAAIANNPEFREVTTWAIMPSSGTDLNENMMNFKEKARYCMKGMVPRNISQGLKTNNLFLRHTRVVKSHMMSYDERISKGASRHLESIIINDAYLGGKLKGKTVCVFDDYLTNGNSFEAIRNLLKTQKVKKIIFVSLGRFMRPYYYQNYSISGDVFSKGYSFKLKNGRMIDYGEYDDNARREVENLHDIFNL